jgi:hypothetical protein
MLSKMRLGLAASLAGALGLGLVASSAVAAPVGSMAQQIEPASLVEKVHRRCFWHHGHWHCRRHHHHFRAGFFPFSPFIGVGFGFRRSHCHWWGCHRH